MNVKLCVVFGLACMHFRNAEGIEGADIVKVKDFSYNVLVSYCFPGLIYDVSGSIIHERFILTIRSEFPEPYGLVNVTDVVAGVTINNGTDSESREIKINVNAKKLHLPNELLNSTRVHGSIAILELKNNLDLSLGIRILKLPTTNVRDMQEHEKFAVFTGLGANTESESDGMLSSMEVMIVDCPEDWLDARDWHTFCGSSIILQQNINNLSNQSIEISGSDIGGPLVYRKNTIIGISQIAVIADIRLGQHTPARFTEVSHYINFINGVINGTFSGHTTIAFPRG